MAQLMVGQNASHHRLTDRHGANPDTWVVAAFGDNIGFIALRIDGLSRRQNGKE